MSFCIRLIGPVGKALLVVGAAGGLCMAPYFADAADENKEGLDVTLTANIVKIPARFPSLAMEPFIYLRFPAVGFITMTALRVCSPATLPAGRYLA